MTETAGLVTSLPEGVLPLPGSVSRLLVGTEAKITSEDETVMRLVFGSRPSTAVRGELSVRGPQLCLGYLHNEEATASTFDDEGFLLTGDIVEVSPDGDITIVDRLKHIIKCKVSSFPILRPPRPLVLTDLCRVSRLALQNSRAFCVSTSIYKTLVSLGDQTRGRVKYLLLLWF
jgi:hypothetical protein